MKMGYLQKYGFQNPIEINGRRTRNFICLVDSYRRASRQRATMGRYRVGAKNAKQARALLQKAIGFGSVMVYYEDSSSKLSDPVAFGECMLETFNPDTNRFDHTPARHITKISK